MTFTVLNANQNPASLVVFAVISEAQRLDFLEATLIIARKNFFFNMSASFEATAYGELLWEATRIGFGFSASAFNLSLSTDIKAGGIDETVFRFGMSF